ncbi:acyltransferase [uncultured Pseudomonas sp.]|uniref:acyltransferase family protein n=1 Tax=uncultured Pseudomonas sp. TaxID=114707 RepID=UPI00258D5C2D|nr:acyltransferase [uncultured Pseudomonas sp.]
MIRNIQFLRFLAAGMVVIAHSPLTLYGVSPYLIKLGGFGVDVFFVISGFIIPFILFPRKEHTNDTTTTSWATFISRRFFRVWPLYFLMSLFVIALSYAILETPLASNQDIALAYNPSKLDMRLFLESMSFTHAFIAPTINVGWTLQFEFAFYITIALIIFMGVRRYETLTLTFACILFASSLTLAAVQSSGVNTEHSAYRPLLLISHPMMFEFLLGMILFRIFRNGLLIRKSFALMAAVIAIPAFIACERHDLFGGVGGTFHRTIVWGGFAFLLVWAALSLEKHIAAPKWSMLLGDSSYSLYLVHWLALPWITYLIGISCGFDALNSALLMIINLVSCIVISIAVHLLIEKPIQQRFRKLQQSWSMRAPGIKALTAD